MKLGIRLFAAFVFLIALPVFAGGKTSFSAPIVSCASTGSGATVDLVVMGGATGAPAGFTVHWILYSEYEQHGWSGGGTSYCEASFSGNASGHYYSLAPGESVKISIGEPFTIAGASSRCNGALLKCGQTYAFRAFAHGNSSQNRSAWSATTFCSTRSCAGGPGDPDQEPNTGCTQGAGYFALTGPSVPGQIWPVTGLMLGNIFYTDVELEAILNLPSPGTGLIELAQQLIAAKLNVASGAGGGTITSQIAAADAVIGNMDVRTGTLSPFTAALHIKALTDFNQGTTGPGYCE